MKVDIVPVVLASGKWECYVQFINPTDGVQEYEAKVYDSHGNSVFRSEGVLEPHGSKAVVFEAKDIVTPTCGKVFHSGSLIINKVSYNPDGFLDISPTVRVSDEQGTADYFNEKWKKTSLYARKDWLSPNPNYPEFGGEYQTMRRDVDVRELVQIDKWTWDDISQQQYWNVHSPIGLPYDEGIFKIYGFANKTALFQYAKDTDTMGHSDYWMYPYEMWRFRKGDCEDFAIMLCALAHAFGVPSYRIKVCVGKTISGPHAWCLYLRESDDEWVCFDGTSSGCDPVAEQEPFRTLIGTPGFLYTDIYFTFNKYYCWSEDSEQEAMMKDERYNKIITAG